jgi:hypothetical protein
MWAIDFQLAPCLKLWPGVCGIRQVPVNNKNNNSDIRGKGLAKLASSEDPELQVRFSACLGSE